ncbi:MAG: hypothetical protein KAR42_15430 [candidate division Zixibacteria bacterium]|nr:hypothetical protein [candidate division Zixibacteria bacterium]
MIELEVNGAPYADFISASVTLALDTLANDFTFVATAVKGFPPFKDGDRVTVTVDEEQVLEGFIDGVEGEESDGSHLISYSGRDKTQDLIDSDIDVIPDIRADGDLTLKRLIEIVIEHIGADIQVVDTLEPDPFNAAEDIAAPKVGENALEFIMFYATKRQAILTSDGDGNIVITQSSPINSEQILQSVDGWDNNIITQSWVVASRNKFNRYIAKGQLDPVALNLTPSPDIAEVQSQGNEVTDEDVRAGRQRVITEKKGYSSEQLANRAKWSKQLAKAKATRFSCVVKGHSKGDGGIWIPNELAYVISQAADIQRAMLINSLTFTESEGQRTATALNLVERDVYTINEKILSQKPTGEQNDAFTN